MAGADPSAEPKNQKEAPILKLKFLSHGTLESRDIEASRRFYQEFLGLEVVRTSRISLLIRLGCAHSIAVVQRRDKAVMSRLNHNGLDVSSEAEVDAAYQKVLEYADHYGLKNITRPAVQHGTYSFYFWDMDDNAWEILANPDGGYSWLFEMGDQDGRGHLSRSFQRPASTLSNPKS